MYLYTYLYIAPDESPKPRPARPMSGAPPRNLCRTRPVIDIC